MKTKTNLLNQQEVAPMSNATDQELQQLAQKLRGAIAFPWKIEKAKRLFANITVLPI